MSSRTPAARSHPVAADAPVVRPERLLRAVPPLPPPPPVERLSGRILYVASTGGHLAELNRLAARFDARPDSVWVTADSQQSRSVLAGRNVHHVPYVASRDLLGTLRAFVA